MFKVLVLKKFHGLSDDATEEQIFDRTRFNELRYESSRGITSSSGKKPESICMNEDSENKRTPASPAIAAFLPLEGSPRSPEVRHAHQRELR